MSTFLKSLKKNVGTLGLVFLVLSLSFKACETIVDDIFEDIPPSFDIDDPDGLNDYPDEETLEL